jgi:hypothetical protein
MRLSSGARPFNSKPAIAVARCYQAFDAVYQKLRMIGFCKLGAFFAEVGGLHGFACNRAGQDDFNAGPRLPGPAREFKPVEFPGESGEGIKQR